MRVTAQHCSRLRSRVACQNAMDPYCGWNELKEQCTPAPNHDPLAAYWKQSVTQCPVLTDPGKWYCSCTPCGGYVNVDREVENSDSLSHHIIATPFVISVVAAYHSFESHAKARTQHLHWQIHLISHMMSEVVPVECCLSVAE